MAQTADERRAYQREWARRNRSDPAIRAAMTAKACAKRAANPEKYRAIDRVRQRARSLARLKRDAVCGTAPTLTQTDLHWLAGLIEGEGCFTAARTHNKRSDKEYLELGIKVSMTDEDTIQRVKGLLKPPTGHVYRYDRDGRRPGRTKPIYSTGVYGNRAAGWMMTLWPLMGSRRRAKITECLRQWNAYQTDYYSRFIGASA